MLAFKLDGKAKLEIAPPSERAIPKPPVQSATAEDIKAGDVGWAMFDCATCHGGHAMALGKFAGKGAIPDLRYSPLLHSQAAFDSVVLQGGRVDLGMISFGDRGMTPEQAGQIRAFVIEQAWKVYKDQNPDSKEK